MKGPVPRGALLAAGAIASVAACHQEPADPSQWVQSTCAYEVGAGRLFVEWTRNADDPRRRAHRNITISNSGAAFRVAPMYFGSDREDILALEFHPSSANTGLQQFSVVRRANGKQERVVMGNVTDQCAQEIHRYLAENPLTAGP